MPAHHEFKTGDLLLCHHGSINQTYGDWLMGKFTSLIDLFTASPYSHIAMVLRNPTFLSEPVPFGLYVWESSYDPNIPDPQDGTTHKIGVRITPFVPFLELYKQSGGRVVHRPLVGTHVEACFSNQNLRKVHDTVYKKPYDLKPADWIAAAMHPQKEYPCTTSRFWCSALVAYIYRQCGVLASDTQWTTMRPCDFDLTTDAVLQYTSPDEVKLSDSIVYVDLDQLNTTDLTDTYPV